MFDFENYKGKFNILIDKKDGGIKTIDEAKRIITKNHDDAIYYGVPVYIGENETLNSLVENLDKKYDTDTPNVCVSCEG